MKKIILLSAMFALASCAYSDNSKNNEEIQYYSFNEKNKPVVKKEDIYITRVTKTETLNSEIASISSKYNGSKAIGSWEFSQKPSKKLKDEITDKAVELGANNIILFEKKNCGNIDIKKNQVEAKPGNNCYYILYYNLPADVKQAKETNEVKEVKEIKEVKEPKAAKTLTEEPKQESSNKEVSK